jgi:hypothetical protein
LIKYTLISLKSENRSILLQYKSLERERQEGTLRNRLRDYANLDGFDQMTGGNGNEEIGF